MDRVFNDIRNEMARAGQKYAPEFASMNEALGTIRAEYCELEDAIVQHQGGARVREEAIQVADRVLVMARGEIVGEYRNDDVTTANLIAASGG